MIMWKPLLSDGSDHIDPCDGKYSRVHCVLYPLQDGDKRRGILYGKSTGVRPLIYNRFSRHCKNKYIKVNRWTAIGEKFDKSENDDKKFKNTRAAFGRFLRKEKTVLSGSCRATRRK